MHEYSGVIERINAAVRRIEDAARAPRQVPVPDMITAAERSAHAQLRSVATRAVDVLNTLIDGQR